MKEKLAKFMNGRYGADQLYRWQFGASIVAFVLSMLLGEGVLAGLLNLAALGLLIWALFRAMSRNIQKRYLENLHFMQKLTAIKNKFKLQQERVKQRKEYKFFSCPTCKTTLRVPKGKGDIYITCAKCGNRFRGKT